MVWRNMNEGTDLVNKAYKKESLKNYVTDEKTIRLLCYNNFISVMKANKKFNKK
jgi:hypothetical protein